MENIINKMEEKREKPSRLILENRKQLQITGVSKVVSINEISATVVINGTKLNILGNDINIEKLDVNDGELILNGNFNEFKYSGKNVKMSLLKRIFK